MNSAETHTGTIDGSPKGSPDSPSQGTTLDDRLRAEAVRIYQRYAIEVVEALSLCPWAKRARLDGRVRIAVVTEARPEPAHVLTHMEAIAAEPEIEIGLILFPRLEITSREFHRFISEVRDQDTRRHPMSNEPFYMAEFHPVAEPDTASPARLVSFIRRSPDPTLQLVRRTTLEDIRRSADKEAISQAQAILASLADLADLPLHGPIHRPIHERVAESNLSTIERFGIDRMKAILDDIQRDRDESYRRLLHDADRSATRSAE